MASPFFRYTQPFLKKKEEKVIFFSPTRKLFNFPICCTGPLRVAKHLAVKNGSCVAHSKEKEILQFFKK